MGQGISILLVLPLLLVLVAHVLHISPVLWVWVRITSEHVMHHDAGRGTGSSRKWKSDNGDRCGCSFIRLYAAVKTAHMQGLSSCTTCKTTTRGTRALLSACSPADIDLLGSCLPEAFWPLL